MTESDNETHSVWKWSLLFCLTFVVMHDFFLLVHGTPASLQDFGVALAAVVAGHGLGNGIGGGK